MLTLEKLKKIRIENRSNKIIYNLLSTIVGECEQISKNPSNNDIVGILLKIYKNNNLTISECTEDRNELKNSLQKENDFISIYLPKNLSDEELSIIITSQIAANAKLPQVMKYLSENYKGRYNGQDAVKLYNSILNEKL